MYKKSNAFLPLRSLASLLPAKSPAEVVGDEPCYQIRLILHIWLVWRGCVIMDGHKRGGKMPRVSILRFTKDYETVADGLATFLKEPATTQREEVGKQVIEIEGNFEHFVLADMDMWRGHIKFEVKDNRIEGDDDRETRAILAEGIPGFGEVLFSPTVAFVHKRVETRTRTTTITEHLQDGEVVDKQEATSESDSVYGWVDITREIGHM